MREDGKLAGEPLGRLTKRAEFQRVSRGRRVSAETFTLQTRRREGTVREAASTPRVGLTVTKSVGGAVERNRVRRRLREIVRLSGAEGMQPGRDYVVVGRRAALDLTFCRLIDDMSSALGRVHIAPSGQRRSGSRRDTK